MSERSLRLKRDTPLENVIAAFNGLAERVDVLEAKGGPNVHRTDDIDAVGLADAARPKDERAEVRVLIGDQSEGERAYVTFRPEPGRPLVISPEQWMNAEANDRKVAWQIKESLTARHLLADLAAKIDVLADRVPSADRDERVMVRAVSPSHRGPDDDADLWALDPSATGHRAPFTPGDLVVEASGYRGIHRVVAVSVGDEAEAHRRLRLTVKRAEVVVDKDAF